MLVVGLTGGIGSGKTVASDHFYTLGVPVIDTDVIARKIVEPGEPALNALIDRFGPKIISPDGHLDRSALRQIAFSSNENKKALDEITHPAIREETLRQIKACDTGYCLVVVPLLNAESPFRTVMQRVLVVTADREIKIERVKKRSNLSRDEVIRIMDTQLSDEQRLLFADDVIENNRTLDHVYGEVERLHSRYSEMALEVSSQL